MGAGMEDPSRRGRGDVRGAVLPQREHPDDFHQRIKISVLINKADGDRAVEAIHEKFFENQ